MALLTFSNSAQQTVSGILLKQYSVWNEVWRTFRRINCNSRLSRADVKGFANKDLEKDIHFPPSQKLEFLPGTGITFEPSRSGWLYVRESPRAQLPGRWHSDPVVRVMVPRFIQVSRQQRLHASFITLSGLPEQILDVPASDELFVAVTRSGVPGHFNICTIGKISHPSLSDKVSEI